MGGGEGGLGSKRFVASEEEKEGCVGGLKDTGRQFSVNVGDRVRGWVTKTRETAMVGWA